MDIINELKRRYKTGSIVFKLIFINVAVFLLIGILNFFSLFGLPKIPTRDWFGLSADVGIIIYKPWTLITYMFMHAGIGHIFFNMLWLFFLGQLFIQFLTPKRMLSVYLLGGLSGALLFVIAINFLPTLSGTMAGANVIGASASVYAIIIAVIVYVPNYSVGLFLIGRVKLKYIGFVLIIWDILSVAGEDGAVLSNAGGHIAHLGGALFGFLFAIKLKKGKDITKGFAVTMDFLFSMLKRKPKMKVTSSKYRKQKPSQGTSSTATSSDIIYNKNKKASQEEIDRILDKISKNGYDSLTKGEKDTLFDMSKK